MNTFRIALIFVSSLLASTESVRIKHGPDDKLVEKLELAGKTLEDVEHSRHLTNGGGRGLQEGIVGRSCLDLEEWVDAFEDGCAWYFFFDGCDDSHFYTNEEAVDASVACCFCGGGMLDDVVHPVETPDDCRNVPGFYDSDFDGCGFYARNPHFCESHGGALDVIPGLTANVACCACGGGIRGA